MINFGSTGFGLKLPDPLLRSAVLVAAFSTLLVTWGCSNRMPNALTESMVVTFSQPDFVLPTDASFTWYSDLVYVDEEKPFKLSAQSSVLQTEIQQYLLNRNFHFPRDYFVAQYGLIAVVVVGDDLLTADLLKQFKLTPSFPSSWRYQKGTIVAAIVDPTKEKVVWRGALQANVDPKQSPQIQQARMREGIHRLFSRLPRAAGDQ